VSGSASQERLHPVGRRDETAANWTSKITVRWRGSLSIGNRREGVPAAFLYLPEEQAADGQRRQKAGVPELSLKLEAVRRGWSER
jgi:hypothetical protein